MGYLHDTNLKIIYTSELPKNDHPQELESEDTKKFIHENKIIILDTQLKTSYLHAFSGMHFSDELVPTIVELERGAGGPGFNEFLGLFLNPASDIYLPKLIISGLVVDLTKSSIVFLVKELMKKLRKTEKKRQQIMYITGQTIEYYEFSSEAEEEDIEEGLYEIPGNSKHNKKNAYYIRGVRNKKWIEEIVE
jgi:hypothetical protein